VKKNWWKYLPLLHSLLKYISKKYFAVFDLTDEGRYWETNDELLLQETFIRYERALNTLADALQSGILQKGENAEDYVSRLIQGIKTRRS